MNYADRELNAHQKAVIIALLLDHGSELTTDGVARITGLTWDGAEYMMSMIATVMSIDKIDGKWRLVENPRQNS